MGAEYLTFSQSLSTKTNEKGQAGVFHRGML
jgi:hypothetical protein